MSVIIKSQHLKIPFRDIEIATRNFTTIIGSGGYGDVYKGELLLSGKLTPVAVKRLKKIGHSGQGLKEFLTEIQLLSRYKHPNLVSLLGYCEEGNEKILIYEYAVYGSLDRYLSMANPIFPLPWKQRIKICIDAARGLDYLHNHVAENHRVIHRDIKSGNILLDHNFKAMISDLGLSKIGRANENESYLITNGSGTYGYCDPVYIDTGILTKESDIYSFGVVLFEVLCGRPGFINVSDERRFLAPLAQSYCEKGNLNDIIDHGLKNQIDSNSLNRFAGIAYLCLQNDRNQRPSMGLVIKKLEKALELQELAESSELVESSKPQVMEKINPNNNNDIICHCDDKHDEASSVPLIVASAKSSTINVCGMGVQDETTSDSDVYKEENIKNPTGPGGRGCLFPFLTRIRCGDFDFRFNF